MLGDHLVYTYVMTTRATNGILVGDKFASIVMPKSVFETDLSQTFSFISNVYFPKLFEISAFPNW